MSTIFEKDLTSLKDFLNQLPTNDLKSHLGISSFPSSLDELERFFPFDKYPQYGFIRLWVLGELASLGVDWATNLKSLKATMADLTQIPDSIGNLKNLEKLNLNGNSITSIPDSIGNLKKLKHLDLGNNYLNSLPDSIGNLESLEELILYYNHLETLPESIGQLKNLRFLNLNCLNSENPVTLPKTIVLLSNLEGLTVQGNEDAITPDIREQLKNCSIG